MKTYPLLQKECPVCHIVIQKGAFEAMTDVQLAALGAITQIAPLLFRFLSEMEINPVTMRNEAIITALTFTGTSLILGVKPWQVPRIAVTTFTGAILVYGVLIALSLAIK